MFIASRPPSGRRGFLAGTLRLLAGAALSPLPLQAMDGTDKQSGGSGDTISLFLCGDVMTGRGVDQVLPHPCNPRIFESYMKSAEGYVQIAEEANGSIPAPVDFDYIWGDALAELDRRRVDRRIINLETAVTRSDDAAAKGINYRMSPEDFPSITAAGIDCCVLANNHVLDWGGAGLLETLETIDKAGVAVTGAGHNETSAGQHAVLSLPNGGRVLVFAYGHESSGVPRSWAARPGRPGVNFLPDLGENTARDIGDHIAEIRQPEDKVIVSIHWGGNWGYRIPEAQQRFARALIDSGAVDIIHGHSSHHPKGMEVYRERLILYGCGDFLNDYEGIPGHEEFRPDLVLMYLPEIRPDGALARLTMAPFRIRRFRLQRASEEESAWLAGVMDCECGRLGAGVSLQPDETLMLHWSESGVRF